MDVDPDASFQSVEHDPATRVRLDTLPQSETDYESEAEAVSSKWSTPAATPRKGGGDVALRWDGALVRRGGEGRGRERRHFYRRRRGGRRSCFCL